MGLYARYSHWRSCYGRLHQPGKVFLPKTCGKGGCSMKIVAVTACPTGIAHTYMAAARLEKTAKDLGHEIKVETQGALGIENALSENDIRQATVVILAVDIGIEGRDRFKDVRIIEVPLREAITNTKAIFERIS